MRITIVTPSLNQGAYIERTIESVLAQRGEFELEYLIVDGGSTDGTLDVLRRHDHRLTWTSGPDRGQSDAINRGFRAARGDVLAWLNSDDVYEPGALAAAAHALRDRPRGWCFGDARVIDVDGREIRGAISRWKRLLARHYSASLLLTSNFIPQPTVFFRRELLEETGALDERYHLAMDYDLWLRFARVSEPVYLGRPLAGFRWHAGSKSGARYARMAWEAFRIAGRHARGPQRLILAEHAVHVAALTAGYRLLDALPSARRRDEG